MKILDLDLGTNSIGWAVVNADESIFVRQVPVPQCLTHKKHPQE